MLTLTVVSQKGGAGKTTLTVHLAVAAQLSGEQVAILDTDPQHSASAWARTREDEKPAVVEVDPGEVPDALAMAKRDGYTLVVLDTSPRAEPIAAATCRAADFVLAPVRPSAFDLATLEQTVAIIVAAGKASASAIVLNGCPTRAPEVAEAQSLCEGLTVPRAPVELGLRRAFARAVQSGRAVQEFEPSGAAAAEIAALWAYIHKRMRRSPLTDA